MGSSRAGTAFVAARRWLQHRAGAEVLEVRPPTRIAGREELQVVAQVTSLSYENVMRASGVDGRRPDLSTQQKR